MHLYFFVPSIQHSTGKKSLTKVRKWSKTKLTHKKKRLKDFISYKRFCFDSFGIVYQSLAKIKTNILTFYSLSNFVEQILSVKLLMRLSLMKPLSDNGKYLFRIIFKTILKYFNTVFNVVKLKKTQRRTVLILFFKTLDSSLSFDVCF